MDKDVFRYSDCPMHRSMAILGSKWKPILIYTLRERTARFGQLHASVGTISKKVLASTLKELEADGVIFREEFKELPPRVEYSLTEKGRTLVPIIVQLAKWDNLHYEHKKENHPVASAEPVLSSPQPSQQLHSDSLIAN